MTEREALQRISDWCDAYPIYRFGPDQDVKRAGEILAPHGISIDSMHGMWARHLLSGIKKIAASGLEGEDDLL